MDVTQSAFVDAYTNLHTFDPTRRFFSWIYRIACNRALKVVEQRRPNETVDPEAHHDGSDPEAVYGSNEASDFLQRALADLGPNDRVVIVLKHVLGYSYREIGELLDVPEKTVKSRLFTARRRLRMLLLEKGYAP